MTTENKYRELKQLLNLGASHEKVIELVESYLAQDRKELRDKLERVIMTIPRYADPEIGAEIIGYNKALEDILKLLE